MKKLLIVTAISLFISTNVIAIEDYEYDASPQRELVDSTMSLEYAINSYLNFMIKSDFTNETSVTPYKYSIVHEKDVDQLNWIKRYETNGEMPSNDLWTYTTFAFNGPKIKCSSARNISFLDGEVIENNETFTIYNGTTKVKYIRDTLSAYIEVPITHTKKQERRHNLFDSDYTLSIGKNNTNNINGLYHYTKISDYGTSTIDTTTFKNYFTDDILDSSSVDARIKYIYPDSSKYDFNFNLSVKYSYLPSGKLEYEQIYYTYEGKTEYLGCQKYSYDGNGNLILKERLGNEVEPFKYQQNVYIYIDNVLSIDTFTIYDKANPNNNDSNLTYIKYYNSNGKIDEKIELNTVSSGETGWFKIEYTYDNNENLISTYQSNGEREKKSKYEYFDDVAKIQFTKLNTIKHNPLLFKNGKISLNLKTESSVHVNVLNLKGQVVLDRKLSESQNQLDCTSLSTGIFFYRAVIKGAVYTGKINIR